MLNKFLLTTLSLSIILSSCSSDDSDTTPENQEAIIGNETPNVPITDPIDIEINIEEEQAIQTSLLEDGIEIEGASKVIGNPPESNDNVDFVISTDENEAFQSTGFTIGFSSNDTDVAGAYIQIKDAQGMPIEGYFDIPASEFENEDDFGRKIINNSLSGVSQNKRSSKSLEDGDLTIKVDFTELIPPGEFCYDICLYDSDII